MTTLFDAVIHSLVLSAKGNSNTSAPAAAILWPDKDGIWESVVPKFAAAMPELFSFGAFNQAQRTGPAIWLKCAIAGAFEDCKYSGVPLVYLPGVSRTDLRAIENCPRDLQPLAELQYRGVFWSQSNGKDWTLAAFLSSKNGGLGLDVAGDKATHEALGRALAAGVLLERSVKELQAQAINAAWLDALVLPNPARDMLVWLNDPGQVGSQWAGPRWEIFVSRCGKDFGFDPIADGALAAAEKLAGRTGAWASVWELYRDSFASFPAVAELLGQLQAPKPKGLFDDLNELAGYPQANEDAEGALRYRLHACAAMTPELARASIRQAEQEHGDRRAWLWARMGRSSLAGALEHLELLASLSAQTGAGTTLTQLAGWYQDTGWKLDQAAMHALAAVSGKTDNEAVCAALKALYVPWLEACAYRFQDLVKAEGRLGLPSQAPGAVKPQDGVCTVFVDGLRYDVAMRLKDELAAVGQVQLSAAWTSMPSVTASGKAWASPVAPFVAGKKEDADFQPSVAADGKALSTHNFRKLLAEQGYQVLDKHETGAPDGRAWVECGDLDHFGHEHGLRLARDIESQLAQIVERIAELNEGGWARFRIVTDHGWLLVPGGLPKTELSKFEAETRWGRCAVLKDNSHGTDLTFAWDWCKDVQIAFAPGIGSFIAGAEYAHGGLTLQECLVPILEVLATSSPVALVKVDIAKVAWTGMRCKVEVSAEAGVDIGVLKVDIRTKAALPDSSLVSHAKPLAGGKASLAVEDDSKEGTAAFLVILDAAGKVVQKKPTTVGE
ncbi:BREX-1 system phosphatase PglZ type B [Massilia glaciei]|uniref:BREX-1 system phosphatase PglZ type B n=2 Tax=Massilia glaciei TaxID=1524097 RepID=A0A2U2HJ98_9BURK|nr:BREX-1 system phosphatase PglZ type B [Massilia glaciei]